MSSSEFNELEEQLRVHFHTTFDQYSVPTGDLDKIQSLPKKQHRPKRAARVAMVAASLAIGAGATYSYAQNQPNVAKIESEGPAAEPTAAPSSPQNGGVVAVESPDFLTGVVLGPQGYIRLVKSVQTHNVQKSADGVNWADQETEVVGIPPGSDVLDMVKRRSGYVALLSSGPDKNLSFAVSTDLVTWSVEPIDIPLEGYDNPTWLPDLVADGDTAVTSFDLYSTATRGKTATIVVALDGDDKQTPTVFKDTLPTNLAAGIGAFTLTVEGGEGDKPWQLFTSTDGMKWSEVDPPKYLFKSAPRVENGNGFITLLAPISELSDPDRTTQPLETTGVQAFTSVDAGATWTATQVDVSALAPDIFVADVKAIDGTVFALVAGISPSENSTQPSVVHEILSSTDGVEWKRTPIDVKEADPGGADWKIVSGSDDAVVIAHDGARIGETPNAGPARQVRVPLR